MEFISRVCINKKFNFILYRFDNNNKIIIYYFLVIKKFRKI